MHDNFMEGLKNMNYEYKAVYTVPKNTNSSTVKEWAENEVTQKMNDLAKEGWEYIDAISSAYIIVLLFKRILSDAN